MAITTCMRAWPYHQPIPGKATWAEVRLSLEEDPRGARDAAAHPVLPFRKSACTSAKSRSATESPGRVPAAVAVVPGAPRIWKRVPERNSLTSLDVCAGAARSRFA